MEPSIPPALAPNRGMAHGELALTKETNNKPDGNKTMRTRTVSSSLPRERTPSERPGTGATPAGFPWPKLAVKPPLQYILSGRGRASGSAMPVPLCSLVSIDRDCCYCFVWALKARRLPSFFYLGRATAPDAYVWAVKR